MAYSVDEAWVQQFTDNVTLLSQQQNSVLENTGVQGDAKGDRKFFERVDSLTMTEKTSSNLATSFDDVTHEKRSVTFADYVLNMYVDIRDTKRALIPIQSAYVQNAVASWKRQIDSVINTALLAAASTGTGSGAAFGSTAFDTANQTVDVLFQAGDPIGAGNGTGTYGTNTGLTLAKILKAKAVLAGNHAIAPGDEIFCVIGENEEIDLFGITEFKSIDYNAEKPFALGPGFDLDPNATILCYLYQHVGI